jgi:hypothetical protein
MNMIDCSRYVKRVLPKDNEHTRDHFEESRSIIIMIDFDHHTVDDQQVLTELVEYFSSYGNIDSSNYCHVSSFSYIEIQFVDRGKQVNHVENTH